MNLSPKHLIKILQPTNKTVIAPVHGSRDLKKGTFLAILKQADISKDGI